MTSSSEPLPAPLRHTPPLSPNPTLDRAAGQHTGQHTGPNSGAGNAVHSWRTGSGVQVLCEPIASAVSASVGLWVTVGSRDEGTRTHGCSHLLEHLLFRGTHQRSARQIVDEVEQVGGTINAFTTQEETCYWAYGLGSHLEGALDVLADMVVAPSFDDGQLEAERPVVLSEIDVAADDAEARLHQATLRSRFGEHALTRPILGTAEQLAAMTAGTVRSHFSQHYRPDRLIVTAAGAVDPDQLARWCETRLGDLSRPEPSRTTPRTAPQVHGDDVRIIAQPGEQAHVTVAVAGPPSASSQVPALAVLSTLLGGGMSSRLFQQVRERHALAYTTFAHLTVFADASMLSLYAGTTADRATLAAQLLQQELEQLAETVTAREVEDARRRLVAARQLSAESSGDRMRSLGVRAAAGLPQLSLQDTIDRFEAVDVAAVQALAAHLAAQPRSVVVAAPAGTVQLEPLAATLRR